MDMPDPELKLPAEDGLSTPGPHHRPVLADAGSPRSPGASPLGGDGHIAELTT